MFLSTLSFGPGPRNRSYQGCRPVVRPISNRFLTSF